MLLNFHIPNYFSKKVREEIGELYASSAIANLALSITLVFEPIFLYSVLHFTIQQIFLFFAVVYAVYLPGIILGGKFASKYGYKHAMALAVPFQILYWGMLLVAKENANITFIAAIAFGLQKSM